MTFDTKPVYDAIRHFVQCTYNAECTDIHMPEYRGYGNNVFFADTKNNGTYVFKLTHGSLAQKNMLVSQLLAQRDMPVPQIRALYTAQYAFECYPMLAGETLEKRINIGDFSYEDIVAAYHKMMDINIDIERVYFDKLAHIPMMWAQNIAYKNTCDRNGRIVGTMAALLTRMANVGLSRDLGLYHFDLNQRNVIFASDGRLTGVLDMDSVGLCNRHFALAMMLAKYKRLGYDIGEQLDYYQDKTHVPLNRWRIKAMADIVNGVKHKLWKHANNNNSR